MAERLGDLCPEVEEKKIAKIHILIFFFVTENGVKITKFAQEQRVPGVFNEVCILTSTVQSEVHDFVFFNHYL